MGHLEILILLWVVIASLCAYLPIELYYLLIIYLLTIVGSAWIYIKTLYSARMRRNYLWSLVLSMCSLIAAVILLGTASSYSLFLITIYLLLRSIIVSLNNYSINKEVQASSGSEASQAVLDRMVMRIEQMYDKIEEIDQKSSTSPDTQAMVEVMNDVIAGLLKERSKSQNEKTLHDDEIRKMLLRAFTNAQKEVNIISPWISNYVVDGAFIRLLEQALKRGVTVKILYGINEDRVQASYSRSDTSQKTAQILKNRFKKYEQYFKIRQGNTHEKLLLCDETFFMIGSFNLLSFKGEYKENTRKEVMLYSENSDIIKRLRKKYFEY